MLKNIADFELPNFLVGKTGFHVMLFSFVREIHTELCACVLRINYLIKTTMGIYVQSELSTFFFPGAALLKRGLK